MMKQMTFADAEYAGKRKRTRKELFLIEMDQVVPWKGLIALIEPYYPKGEGGRPAYPLMAMLRVHLMQNWFRVMQEMVTAKGFAAAERAEKRRKLSKFRHASFFEKC
ncbi:hypothetical protein PsyrB_04955 [Pseudomonas syringae pv. syringae B301D]|nr:hypothetical protein PsyrB_04955 [Pseudomonas syringae pv. syringae B301D]